MAHVNRLQNARVLVFGGTSGIGFSVANLCISQGAHVIISGSKQAKVDDKVAELKSFYPSLPSGQEVVGYAADLADTPNLEANIKSLLDKSTENGQKKLDHIVFCAGDLFELPTLQSAKPETALKGFNVRWLGGVMIAKLIATGSYMPASTSSSITFTSGTNTDKPTAGFFTGSSIGSAVESLTRSLAVDLKPIRVNIVSPGAIQTPLLDAVVKNVGEEVKEMWKKETLLGELGRPEDIAEAYAWFMKDRFVTGVIAKSEGGRILV
ncbi:NAD(P)-binding protein [Periconia macrospinosa]|uniref:NAD(P)-binding protein n=1 Tax=Periconia macrospinosa TaxID=97972 RepID=A0A2V1ECQ6_9PLEO|nr:NAD(P)-binding protein [Periconia macrospinosa]